MSLQFIVGGGLVFAYCGLGEENAVPGRNYHKFNDDGQCRCLRRRISRCLAASSNHKSYGSGTVKNDDGRLLCPIAWLTFFN